MAQDRQKMIDKIYEIISDKTFSMGCRTTKGVIVKLHTDYDAGEEAIGIIGNKTITWWDSEWFYDNPKEIIGHPVMIGDVLDWLDEYGFMEKGLQRIDRHGIKEKQQETLYWRKYARKPIEEQSIECISFIYSLIEKDDRTD